MDLAEILRNLGTTNRNVGGGGMMGLMQPDPASMAQEAKARQAAQEAYWKEVHRVPPHTPFDKFWARNQVLGYPTPMSPATAPPPPQQQAVYSPNTLPPGVNRVPPHTPYDNFWAQMQMLGYPQR